VIFDTCCEEAVSVSVHGTVLDTDADGFTVRITHGSASKLLKVLSPGAPPVARGDKVEVLGVRHSDELRRFFIICVYNLMWGGSEKMKAMTYIAKVLPDGHLSLPEEIKEKMGLTANSRVKVVLEREAQREKALEAFGAWSEREDIKSGVEYVEEIRAGWNKRTARQEHG
jgi:bifunctional DNA-binding transcriptional regulator/antitoxin component of YhaV-PrlF toxin-antitoxin module